MLHNMLRAAAGRDRIPMDYNARFLFEEPSGTGTLIDETGNNNGSYNSMTSVAGVVGNGLQVSGASPQRANIDAAIDNDPTVFALSGWAKISGTESFLFAHRSSSQALIQLSAQGGSLTYQARSTTSSILTLNSQSAITGSYFHFVLNWNKTGTTEVWVNNSLTYEDTRNISGSFASTLSVVGAFNFGSYGYVGTGNDSAFDLYTVYNGRNLSPEEITQLYNEGA